jgi:ABC-type transport system substrate-binding protein
MLADSWAEIDPKYEVVLALKRWPDILDGATPLCPMQVENGPDPVFINNVYHSEVGYAGYFGYNNPEVDSLLENAQYEINVDKMAEYYIEAQKLVEEDLPGMLTVYYSSFSVTRKYIQGQEYNPVWRATYLYPMEKG